jgi:hypothetical protein
MKIKGTIPVLACGFVLGAAALGCSDQAASTEGAGQTIAASPETRHELGVERWLLSISHNGNASMATATGEDSQGHMAAEFAMQLTMSGSEVSEGQVTITPPGVRGLFVFGPDGNIAKAPDGFPGDAMAVSIVRRVIADFAGSGGTASVAANSLPTLRPRCSIVCGPAGKLLPEAPGDSHYCPLFGEERDGTAEEHGCYAIMQTLPGGPR